MTTGMLICIGWLLTGFGYQTLRLFLKHRGGENITLGHLTDSIIVSLLGPVTLIFGICFYYSEHRSTVLVKGKKKEAERSYPYRYWVPKTKVKKEIEEGVL